MANLKNTSINDTGFLQLPVGTTAQRPTSPQPGIVRFNTDTGFFESFINNSWITVEKPVVPIQATGGEIQDWLIGNKIYRIHAFKSTGTSTFNVTDVGNYGKIDVLVVAGGGNGGARRGGGGGSGGVVFKPNHEITATSYNIVVGAGGGQGVVIPFASGIQNNGSNSSALGLTAIGGGAGGNGRSGNANGLNGGSGGGGSIPAGSSTQTTFTGAFSFGNNGGNGVSSSDDTAGGGGGAGASGQNARTPRISGDGGIGINFSHVFTANYGEEGFFGGGGGGSGNNNASPHGVVGAGGKGGGGRGANGNTSVANDFQQPTSNPNPMAAEFSATSGMANTGGGGGGANSNSGASSAWVNLGIGAAGSGGSGIVLIRYPIEIIYD